MNQAEFLERIQFITGMVVRIDGSKYASETLGQEEVMSRTDFLQFFADEILSAEEKKDGVWSVKLKHGQSAVVTDASLVPTPRHHKL